MAKLIRPRSTERLHYVRSRLRKASCMNNHNACGDDSDELPRPHASSNLSPSNGTQLVEEAKNPYPVPGPSQLSPQVDMDDQCSSAFFTCLPPEIRRMIYIEVWRASDDTMKLHIHGGSDGPRLDHTPCRCSAAESRLDDEDPMRMDSWPGWRGRNQPPRWFWHAWGLRLRWGAHWRCQADAMLAWKTREDGTCVDVRSLRRGSYMDVFLTCKRV